MKLIIAGSRDIDNYELVKQLVEDTLHQWFHSHETGNYYYPVEVVSGRCPVGKLTYMTKDGIKVYGIDGIGERLAEEWGKRVVPFTAQFTTLGKSAGPIRNEQMAKYADRAIIIRLTESKGSKDMVAKMNFFKKPFKEIIIE
jgi:hypothetical protein